MNEEEKQAYNYLKKYIKWETFGERNLEADIKTILNLIKKQQKEIKKLKSRKYIFNAKTNEFKEIPISDDYIRKDDIKEFIEKFEKRIFNQIYGMTLKKQKDYIPITRLDLMTKELKEKGINSIDIGEKVKIQYAINILYQLRFKLKGE